MYDAVHRMYDPQLGRFFQIDKLSELSVDFTPYGFAMNNPIRMNDPLGLKEDTVTGSSSVVLAPSSRKAVAGEQLNKMDYGQITGWIDGQRQKGYTVETIQNWALSNSRINNNTLDKILDATNPNSLAIRQSQDEWWAAEGAVYAALLSFLSGGALSEAAALMELKNGLLLGRAIMEGKLNDTKGQVISKLLKFAYDKFGRQALRNPVSRFLLKERNTYRDILTPESGAWLMKRTLPSGTHIPKIAPPFF